MKGHTARLSKYLGIRLHAGGIVVGARQIDPDTVEFDVLEDGERRTYRIALAAQ